MSLDYKRLLTCLFFIFMFCMYGCTKIAPLVPEVPPAYPCLSTSYEYDTVPYCSNFILVPINDTDIKKTEIAFAFTEQSKMIPTVTILGIEKGVTISKWKNYTLFKIPRELYLYKLKQLNFDTAKLPAKLTVQAIDTSGNVIDSEEYTFLLK